MEKMNVYCVLPLVINSKIIGVGVNSMCFLMTGNIVLKLFKKNDRTKLLLKQKIDNYSFEDKLEMLSNISNDTFVGPEKLLYFEDKLSGYFLKYVGNSSLDKIDKNIRLSNLFINYESAISDIEKISKEHFQIFDLARENMFLTQDNKYKIIDMDRYKYKKNKNIQDIYSENISAFFNMILWTIFDTRDSEYPIFDDKLFQQYILKNIDRSDISSINDFRYKIEEMCEEKDPTILSIRKKIKVKNCHNDYYK